MKYHVGLLDTDPMQNEKYRRVCKERWNHPHFPPELRHELTVWLRMPGFDDQYHIRNLHTYWSRFLQQRSELPPYEQVADAVAENWLSATREDVIKICRLRPGLTSGVPLLCQIAIMDELKRGKSQQATARAFGVTRRMVWNIYHRGIRRNPTWKLPTGFELLVRP